MTKQNNQSITVTLGMTANSFINGSNQEFLRVSKQPTGINFYTKKWGRKPNGQVATGTLIFKNAVSGFQLDHIDSVMIAQDMEHPDDGIQEINVVFSLNDDLKITHAKAYQAMMALLAKLKKAGWHRYVALSEPRLEGKDTVTYALSPDGLTDYIDPNYPLTLNEWVAEASKMSGYSWQLKTDDGAYMSISYYIGREDNYAPDEATYIVSMTITSEMKKTHDHFEAQDTPNWKKLYPDLYNNKFAEWRLNEETIAIAMGLKINTHYKDYKNHYVFKELGIDTSTFKSIDPYKITYKEYMEKKDKPKQPQKAPVKKVSCQGGTPCPETGYWFTPAIENSRQYFNEGDIFPKYDLNSWGVIHWQWDGEDA